MSSVKIYEPIFGNKFVPSHDLKSWLISASLAWGIASFLPCEFVELQ